MSSAKTTEEELTPDGYESLFDGRETERVANLIIGAPGPDTLKRGAFINDVHIIFLIIIDLQQTEKLNIGLLTTYLISNTDIFIILTKIVNCSQ